MQQHYKEFYTDFMEGTSLQRVMWFDGLGDDPFNTNPEGLEEFISYIDECVNTAV
jgi:hypothetical protein